MGPGNCDGGGCQSGFSNDRMNGGSCVGSGPSDDQIVGDAVKAAIAIINNQPSVTTKGQVVTLKTLKTNNIAKSSSGMVIDATFDITVTNKDGTTLSSSCKATVEASASGQIGQVDSVSCGASS